MDGSPRIAFIGAGSVEFTRQLLTDLFGFPELHGATVALHDIDPTRLETAEGIAHRVAADLGVHLTVEACQARPTALDGADYVVNMIQVGGIEATRVDFEVPAQFGLRQTIGDTLGIGGIFRGLRTFPALAGLAADMAALCPDAWLLNYTNPMAMNVAYLHAIAPRLRVVGLCHSIHWTVSDLCDLVGVPMAEVSHHAAGVNHQAWLLRWERDGESLYPALDRLIAADADLRRRVRVDMYRRLGFYPTETSEHSSEYVPWYLPHDGEIERLRIPVGDYLGISADNVAEYERTREALASGAALPAVADVGATEYAPQVIHAMVTGRPARIYGNVPNAGPSGLLIENLPASSTVEVPCRVEADGVHPECVGALPPQCAALNRSYLNPVDLAVAAAVRGDPALIRHAAMLDPHTAAALTVEQIWSLCDAMVAAHAPLLPESLRPSLTP